MAISPKPREAITKADLEQDELSSLQPRDAITKADLQKQELDHLDTMEVFEKTTEYDAIYTAVDQIDPDAKQAILHSLNTDFQNNNNPRKKGSELTNTIHKLEKKNEVQQKEVNNTKKLLKTAAMVAIGIALTVIAMFATGGTILITAAAIGVMTAVVDLAINQPTDAYNELKEKDPNFSKQSLTSQATDTLSAMMRKPMALGLSALTLTGATILLAVLFAPALIIGAPIIVPTVGAILLTAAAITFGMGYNDYTQKATELRAEGQQLHNVDQKIKETSPSESKAVAQVPTVKSSAIPHQEIVSKVEKKENNSTPSFREQASSTPKKDDQAPTLKK